MTDAPDPVLAAWRAYLHDCDRESVEMPAEVYDELRRRLEMYGDCPLPECTTLIVTVAREVLVAALNAVNEMGSVRP